MHVTRPFALAVLTLAVGCSDGAVLLPQSARMQRAIDLGPVAPDVQVDFVVALALRDPVGAQKLIDEHGRNGYVVPADFATRYAAASDDYDRVVAWLGNAGIGITRTTTGHTTISAHGSAVAVEKAFGVSMHQYQDGSDTFVAAASPLRLPASFAATISGVAGLSGSPKWHSQLRSVDTPDLNAPPLTAAQLLTMYSADTVMNRGAGETIAILGTGLPPDPTKEIDAYFQGAYGKTAAAPNYMQVFVGGPNRDDASAAMGEEQENAIDAEMVTLMAPAAKVVHVFTATNSPGLTFDGMAYIVDQLSAAHQASFSFGGCEPFSLPEMGVVETMLVQAQAEGQTWFVAAGDSGSDDCQDGHGNKHATVDYPSSSPHAISVGGTMSVNGQLQAWNNLSDGFGAGGGGASEAFAKPAYQMGVTPNDGARDVPDVAGEAGLPGVAVIVASGNSVFGGTSVAAPIWAGLWSSVDQARGGMGFTDAHVSIYNAGTSNGFVDITVGDNGGPDEHSTGFMAGPGYDQATGWGSPNLPNLMMSVK